MPKVKLQGYFGWKESLRVSAANITTGWLAGSCFKITGPIGDPYNGTAEVTMCNTAGEQVYGIALDSSSDWSTAVAGMQMPSASKVTILHGHSRFEIDHKAEVLASTFAAATCAYDHAWHTVGLPTLGQYLYTNASGKLTNVAVPASGSFSIAGPQAYYSPVGIVTRVPFVHNNYTLGVLMFG